MFDIRYEGETHGMANAPKRGPVPDALVHVFQTGTLFAAELNGHIYGFAGSVTRGDISFLTDLFVTTSHQSAGIGRLLLKSLTNVSPGIHCTLSSTDHRALALYTLAGLQPQWPNFNLVRSAIDGNVDLKSDVTVVEVDYHDERFMAFDKRVSGRDRSQDVAFWMEKQEGHALLFVRHGQPVGYGCVRLKGGSFWNPSSIMIGPLGVDERVDATPCVLAAVDWAQGRGSAMAINVPGLHPALGPLLASRFHIVYVETFVSSAPQPFFDPTRYVGSDSALL